MFLLIFFGLSNSMGQHFQFFHGPFELHTSSFHCTTILSRKTLSYWLVIEPWKFLNQIHRQFIWWGRSHSRNFTSFMIFMARLMPYILSPSSYTHLSIWSIEKYSQRIWSIQILVWGEHASTSPIVPKLVESQHIYCSDNMLDHMIITQHSFKYALRYYILACSLS